MSARASVMVLCAAVLLAGCSAMSQPGGAGEPWAKAGGLQARNETDSLLMYFEYVRRLAPAELAKEQEAVRQLYAASRKDFIRVRYAMVVGVPGNGSGDDVRALDALGPLLKNPDAALHGVAFMVGAQIQEQRRAQGLHEKLDALKVMERQMIERDPATSTRRQ